MKRDNWMKIFLILVMSGMLVWVGVSSYRRGVADLNEQARVAFEKALGVELLNRNLNDSLLSIRSWVDISKKEDVPHSVWIDRGSGMQEYKISAEKHHQNVTKDAETRILHSVALEKSPIIPGTLNAIWQQKLKEVRLIGSTALLVATTDCENHTDSLQTSGYARFASTPHLVTCTLGYCCEVEIVGVVNYSWWYVLTQYAGIRLLSLLGGCILAYLFVGYVMKRAAEIRLVKNKTRIYPLKENLVFYANRKLLVSDGMESVLQSQPCTLFELLLTAEGYQLSDDVIMAKLWPDGSGTAERLRQVVSRLRTSLAVDPSLKIDRTSPGGYQLFI